MKRTILAVDTSNGSSSLALFSRGHEQMFFETTDRDNLGWLRSQVQRLEQSGAMRLADVDLFAIVNGPGALTGVRVGFGFVQSMALALGRPIVGINALATMALQLQQQGPAFGETGRLAVALDARMSEIYGLVIDAQTSPTELLKVNDQLVSIGAELPSQFTNDVIAAAGPGFEAYPHILPGTVKLIQAIRPNARAAGELARYSEGMPASALNVHYLRQQHHVAKIPERLR